MLRRQVLTREKFETKSIYKKKIVLNVRKYLKPNINSNYFNIKACEFESRIEMP